MLLGERLRACRIARQKTMKEFAELCGISERYLADIERGLKAPKLETFVGIANAIGVSTDYLLQDSVTVDKESDVQIQNALNALSQEQQELIQGFITDLAKTLK